MGTHNAPQVRSHRIPASRLPYSNPDENRDGGRAQFESRPGTGLSKLANSVSLIPAHIVRQGSGCRGLRCDPSLPDLPGRALTDSFSLALCGASCSVILFPNCRPAVLHKRGTGLVGEPFKISNSARLRQRERPLRAKIFTPAATRGWSCGLEGVRSVPFPFPDSLIR
jgi:hypothetical protein